MSVEERLLKKTYVGSARQRDIIRLELRVEGFSEDEIEGAFKKLIAEGAIYECHHMTWIKKV